MQGIVRGRIVSHTRRDVQKYVVSVVGQTDTRIISANDIVCVPDKLCAQRIGAGVVDPDQGGEEELEEGYAPQAEYQDNSGTANESGVLANELAGRVASFDVGKMSASDIWNLILLRRDLCGGMLTRSILNAASSDTQCLPLWPFSVLQEKKVDDRKLQGLDFISHFTPQLKLDWLRIKLFTIVTGNRHSYSKLRVTFNGCTSLSLASVRNGVEMTPALRCRIAHLALDPACIKVLSLIFGSRDCREKHDNKELQCNNLWEELTVRYVNNPMWQPYSSAVECLPEIRSLDPSCAPPSPGFDFSIVQDVFLQCRTDWTRLKQRVFSSTGCNSTGDNLLKTVWQNYVNGGRLHFTERPVTMYVFATWLSAGQDLPELCNRQLPLRQQLVTGVREQPAAADDVTPTKNNSSSKSVTPRNSRGSSNEPVLQAIAQV
jgi:hypothetical protein